jgi:Tfp pilus assembly protein PilF
MAQRHTASGRKPLLVWLAIVLVLGLAIALAAVVFIIGPQQQLRQQVQATAEARQAEVERLYQAGVAFQDAGDWEAAQAGFKQVITLDPAYKDVQTRLAEVKAKLTESAATATAETVAQAERARMDAQATATAQGHVTATAQAVAATATAAAVETRYQKALAYINLGRWAEAQVELEAVFEIDPNYKDIQAQLAMVNSEIAKLTPTVTPTPLSTATPAITPTPTVTPVSEITSTPPPSPTPHSKKAAGIEGYWKVVSFLPYSTDSDTLVAVVNDYIFVVGAYDPTKSGYATTDVIRAPILDNGGIGEWKSTAPLSRRTKAGDILSVNNTIYIFGGKAHGDQEHPYNNVIYGVVKDDGAIAGWNETTPLPTGLLNPAAVVYEKTVYVIGGGQWHGKPDDYGRYHYDTLYQALIKPDGSLSSWADANISAPLKGYFSAFVLDDYLYVLAPGAHGSYVSEIAPDGVLSPWQRLGDTVIESEVVVERGLYGVVEGRLSSVGIAAPSRFADYAEGAQLPRPEGVLLHSDGMFYFISGDVIFALLND